MQNNKLTGVITLVIPNDRMAAYVQKLSKQRDELLNKARAAEKDARRYRKELDKIESKLENSMMYVAADIVAEDYPGLDPDQEILITVEDISDQDFQRLTGNTKQAVNYPPDETQQKRNKNATGQKQDKSGTA